MFHLVYVPNIKSTAKNQHVPKCGVLPRVQAKSFIKKDACLCEFRRFGRTVELLILQTPAVFLITTRLLTAHDTDMYAVLTQSSPDLDLQKREREQNEATVNGIVIALGCHGERIFIVRKLDSTYEKLWKLLIFPHGNP